MLYDFTVDSKESNINPFFDVSLEDSAAPANLFCYDLTMPPAPESAFHLAMQQDLHRYFNLSCYSEEVMTECLVLSGKPKPWSKKKYTQGMDLESGTLKKYIRGYEAHQVVEWLNAYSAIPILCEVTSDTPLDLQLPFNLADADGLIRAFANAGLSLKKEKRMLKFAVITDGTLSP